MGRGIMILWPLDVLHTKRIRVVGASNIVAEVLGALTVCACLVVLHRTFECAKSGAKLGCAKLGRARGALSSPRAHGWQRVVLLWLLLNVPNATAASLTLDGSHTDASANLEWLRVGTWFPAQFWNTTGSYEVLMCKYDKAAIARNVAMRAFDQANVTAENCRSAEFEALKTLVDERLSDSCPVPETAFIHHVPHAGSTLLTSMLESIEVVRTWSEYPFASKLSEYAGMADKSDRQEVLLLAENSVKPSLHSSSPNPLLTLWQVIKTLIQLLACSLPGETKVTSPRLPLPLLPRSLSAASPPPPSTFARVELH